MQVRGVSSVTGMFSASLNIVFCCYIDSSAALRDLGVIFSEAGFMEDSPCITWRLYQWFVQVRNLALDHGSQILFQSIVILL